MEASELGRRELALEDVLAPLRGLPDKWAASSKLVRDQLLASRKMVRVFEDGFDEMVRMRSIEEQVEISISLSHTVSSAGTCQ